MKKLILVSLLGLVGGMSILAEEGPAVPPKAPAAKKGWFDPVKEYVTWKKAGIATGGVFGLWAANKYAGETDIAKRVKSAPGQVFGASAPVMGLMAFSLWTVRKLQNIEEKMDTGFKGLKEQNNGLLKAVQDVGSDLTKLSAYAQDPKNNHGPEMLESLARLEEAAAQGAQDMADTVAVKAAYNRDFKDNWLRLHNMSVSADSEDVNKPRYVRDILTSKQLKQARAASGDQAKGSGYVSAGEEGGAGEEE